MDCGGRDTVLQDAYDIDSLVISIETIKRQASSLKCSPVTSGPSEPRRDTKVYSRKTSGKFEKKKKDARATTPKSCHFNSRLQSARKFSAHFLRKVSLFRERRPLSSKAMTI